MSGISSEATSSIDYFSDARVIDGHVNYFQVQNNGAGVTIPNNANFSSDLGLVVNPFTIDVLVKLVFTGTLIQCQVAATGVVLANGYGLGYIGTSDSVDTATVTSLNLDGVTAGAYEAYYVTDFGLVNTPVFYGAGQAVGDVLTFVVPAGSGLLVGLQVGRDSFPVGGDLSGIITCDVYIDDMQ